MKRLSKVFSNNNILTKLVNGYRIAVGLLCIVIALVLATGFRISAEWRLRRMLEEEANGFRIVVGGDCVLSSLSSLQLDSALLRNDVWGGWWKPRLMDTALLLGGRLCIVIALGLADWIPHFCGMTFETDDGSRGE